MNKKSISKMIEVISFSLLIFWMILTPLVWILRDGLGHNAVDSVGLLAIKRFFMTFYWGPVLILLIILTLIFKINNKLNINKNV